jgi:hypothetical protein
MPPNLLKKALQYRPDFLVSPRLGFCFHQVTSHSAAAFFTGSLGQIRANPDRKTQPLRDHPVHTGKMMASVSRIQIVSFRIADPEVYRAIFVHAAARRASARRGLLFPIAKPPGGGRNCRRLHTSSRLAVLIGPSLLSFKVMIAAQSTCSRAVFSTEGSGAEQAGSADARSKSRASWKTPRLMRCPFMFDNAGRSSTLHSDTG